MAINTLPTMTGWSPERQQQAQNAQAQSQQNWQQNQRARLEGLRSKFQGGGMGIQSRINALPPPPAAPGAAPAPAQPQTPGQQAGVAQRQQQPGWMNRVQGMTPERKDQFMANHPQIAQGVGYTPTPKPTVQAPAPMQAAGAVSPAMRSTMAEAGINGLQQMGNAYGPKGLPGYEQQTQEMNPQQQMALKGQAQQPIQPWMNAQGPATRQY